MNKTILLSSLLIFILFQTFNLEAQNKQIQEGVEVQVTQAELLGTTPPLRTLIPRSPISRNKRAALKRNKKVPPNFFNSERENFTPNPNAQPQGADPVRQLTQEQDLSFLVEPLVNVEGMSFDGPPDPTGDVGENHYVQAVNATTIEVFDKEGVSQGEIATNTLWSQVNAVGVGDPIIIYDQEVDRWLITEFTSPGINTFLIGISENSDPFSSYTVYSLGALNFPDYPKYAVWTDIYSIAANEEGSATMVQYFLDKSAMLAGEPNINVQRLTIPATIGGPGIFVSSPVDWSGSNPPINSNPILLSLDDDAWGGSATDLVKVHTVEIDWDNANNTMVTTEELIVSPYDTDPCFPDSGQFGECIPQNGGPGFSGITEVIMNQSHYRNFGSHESIVFCFTVDATAGNNLAGIRWTEIRRTPGGDWAVYQEGTYSLNDGLSRFVPSIAMDGFGNIGLGYSVSSPEMYVDLRYTGRRASDPLGQMTVDEYTLAEGLSPLFTGSRFGDYAHMTIDPIDQNTFWFTGEYAGNNTAATRVAAFRIRRDTTDFAPTRMVSPMSSSDLTSAETVQIEIKNVGLDTQNIFKVGYIFENGPAVINNVTLEMYPDSTYIHTFVPTVDMSAVGDYEFKIFTVLIGDQAIFNDTARIVVSQLSKWDAGISNVSGLENAICSDAQEVAFELTNYGTEVLTSATILVDLNGTQIATFDWTGSLQTAESEMVNILLQNIQNGTNEVLASTANPNGMLDQIMDNDALTRTFNATVGGLGLVIKILTDDYPQETTWEFSDENGTVLYQGGPYQNDGTLEEFGFCVDTTLCYEFTIFDVFGDGICCEFGIGNYEIVDENGTILVQSDGQFGLEESTAFCPIIECLLEATVDVSPDIDMQENGSILITPNNGIAPYMYSIDGGQTFTTNPLFDNLPTGIYQIVVQDAANCDTSLEAEIEMLVPTSEANLELAIEVIPNPNDGVFRLNVKGFQQQENYLPFEILDASGRVVQNGQLSKYDGTHTAMISLFVYPAGVYFVRFTNVEMNRMVRVVKK